MSWENQPGFDGEINRLGAKLSLEINCPVHYPAYDKNIFECECKITFPLFLLRGGDWELIVARHRSNTDDNT